MHIDVAIGSTFSATCTAKGDPAPTYSWFFKDQMIQTGQQLSITGSATTDDGVYTCVATNSLGIRQANMDANVRCKFYIYIYIFVYMQQATIMKKSLNSDRQQFHQYQQNEQLPLTATH